MAWMIEGPEWYNTDTLVTRLECFEVHGLI